MIQAVADEEERGVLGMHYTSRDEHPESSESVVPRRPAGASLRQAGEQPAQASELTKPHG